MKMKTFSLSQNTSFLTIAAVLQKIISALFFFLVSWIVGTEQTAAYFNVFAAIAVFTVVADFGMNNVLTREAARENAERAPILFSQALFIKLLFGLVALVSLGISKILLDYPGGAYGLTVVAGITLWFDSVRSLMYAYLRAHKNVRFEAVGLVGAQCAITVVGILMLVLKFPLIVLVSVFMVVSFFQTLYAMYCVKQYGGAVCVPRYDARLARHMLREALPFAVAGIIAQVYAYQDAFIIHRYLPPTDGGDWARAYKIVFAFQFIPISLGASMYPVISAAAGRDMGRIVWIIKRSYEYLLLISLPIMAGITIVAEPLLSRYAPSFVASFPVLRILVWSLGFGFLWFTHGAILNGNRRQNIQTFFVACACASSILINVFFVPRYGIQAAGVAAVLSNLLLWILGYGAISRFVTMPHRALLCQTMRIAAATATMAGGVMVAQLIQVPPLFLIPLGVIVYGIGLVVFKALSADMLLVFRKKLAGRFSSSNSVV